MNPMLVKVLVGSVPVFLLLLYSVAVLVTRKTMSAVLQLLGATCLVVVVLSHFAEALHLLPAMRWGEPDSVGHYVDLSSAVLGVMLDDTNGDLPELVRTPDATSRRCRRD